MTMKKETKAGAGAAIGGGLLGVFALAALHPVLPFIAIGGGAAVAYQGGKKAYKKFKGEGPEA